MKLLMVLLVFTIPVMGQSAKVVALTPEETVEIKQLQVALEKAKSEQALFQLKIRDKYLVVKDKKGTPQHQYMIGSGYKQGWEYGDFQFSEDYKYIVPESHSGVVYGGNVTPYYWNGQSWQGCTNFPSTSSGTITFGNDGVLHPN